MTDIEKTRRSFRLHREIYQQSLSDLQEPSVHLRMDCDFSLVHPVLHPENNRNYIDKVGRGIFSLLPLYSGLVNFDILLSGPTLLEILDDVDHKRFEYKKIYDSNDLASRIHGLIFKTADAEKALLEAQRRLPNDGQHAGLQVIIDLIRKRTVASIGDYYEDQMATLATSQAREIFDQVKGEVLRHKKYGQADPDDREFHIDMDVFRIISTDRNHDADPGSPVVYIGSPRLRVVFGSEMNEYSRRSRSPLATLKAYAQASSQVDIREESKSFLETGIEDFERCLGILKNKKSFGEVFNNDLSTVAHVDRKYIDYLYRTDGDHYEVAKAERDESIRAMAEDVGSLRDFFKTAEEKLAERQKVIANLVPSMLDDSAMEEVSPKGANRIRQICAKL